MRQFNFKIATTFLSILALSISSYASAKKMSETDCKYAYSGIYKTYVDQAQDADSCQGEMGNEPEQVAGMSTARAYYSDQADPAFNSNAFQSISKSSCMKKVTHAANPYISYSDFRHTVCGKK